MLLAALVITGAGWLCLHVALWVRVLHSSGVARWLRAAACLPPITLLAGFRARAFVLTGLWCVFAAAYLVLRTAS